MSHVGILAFDLYNQEGKNELYISKSPDFIQALRLRIRNTSLSHVIKMDKGESFHFSIVFKKGLLPPNFDHTKIRISKWREIAGADLFNLLPLEQ
ncbi:MAG: hypothetical protein ACPGJS_22845, partial [Flammeovirgaceae bacterium]